MSLHPLCSHLLPSPHHSLLSSPSCLLAAPATSLGLCIVVSLPGLQILPDIQLALNLTFLRFLLTETIPDHSISNRHFLTSVALLNSLPYCIFLHSTNLVCHHIYLTYFLLHLSPPLTGEGRRWHRIPVLLPGKSHGRRSLVGCSPWGHEESDTTERLHFHFSLHALEKEMATHSSVLAWRIPGTGEPGGLPSMAVYAVSHRVGHD